jgi:hypothetical protein
MRSAGSKAEGAINRRESNVASALHFPSKRRIETEYVGVDDAKDTLIESLQKAKQQRKLDATAVRQIHSFS